MTQLARTNGTGPILFASRVASNVDEALTMSRRQDFGCLDEARVSFCSGSSVDLLEERMTSAQVDSAENADVTPSELTASPETKQTNPQCLSMATYFPSANNKVCFDECFTANPLLLCCVGISLRLCVCVTLFCFTVGG